MVLVVVGRRRPVIMIGSLAVALALFILGWTKEIVGIFFSESDFVSGLGGATGVELGGHGD